MGKIFFTPLVYVQNDGQKARHGDHFEVYAGVPNDPPTGPKWLTARPAYPLGLSQRRGRGGGAPHPLQPLFEHPSGSHPARQPPPVIFLYTGQGTQR